MPPDGKHHLRVRIHKTEVYKGKRVTTYTVRWKVGPKSWKAPYRNKAQAESFLAELRTAARKGEAFSVTTGRPVSWGRVADKVTWYDFCCSYVDMKWKGASGKHRRDIAWTLTAAMPAMISTARGKPSDTEIRTALWRWAFNTKNRNDCPEDVARTVAWLARSTKPVTELADPKVARAMLDLIATRLDGKPAAASTIRRNRAILNNACEYAVELGLLAKNPLQSVKWKMPNTSHAVDSRSVINATQARRLLEAIHAQKQSGPRLVAFFAVMYYAGLRPEEAVNLREENITLPSLVWNEGTAQWEEPADYWGELRSAQLRRSPVRTGLTTARTVRNGGSSTGRTATADVSQLHPR